MPGWTRALQRWVGKQLGFGGAQNLRLIWPENWHQTGRDMPTGGANALTFPAVYASIDIISSDIARLPLRHWKDDGITRTEVRDSWECSVLDQPNAYQTGFDMMKMLVASQLFRGNGYLFARRNRRYQVDELHPIFPDFVLPFRALGPQAGPEYFYQVSAQPLAEIDVTRMVPPREMFHHRMLVFNDALIGISPMVAAAVSSSAGLAILRQSERFFTRMSRPSGVLQTAKQLDQRKAEQIKERWQRVYAGEEGAGDIVVLEEGLEWKPLTLTAVEAQLIEQLRYAVEDVARVYRLPLFMLGDLTKATYSSSEQLTQMYLNGCLSAHMESLEWRLSQFFGMDGRSEYLQFDTDRLLRAELRTRIEALAKAVQGGIRTPNEARRIEGLNAVEGGDTVFMQQQMVPVNLLAGRSDLNPKPPMMPGTAPSEPRREIAPPAALDGPTQAKGLSAVLDAAVFDNPPPARPSAPYAQSVLAMRHQQRRLIYGRGSSTLH
jgi:HK97 family phage portal protein